MTPVPIPANTCLSGSKLKHCKPHSSVVNFWTSINWRFLVQDNLLQCGSVPFVHLTGHQSARDIQVKCIIPAVLYGLQSRKLLKDRHSDQPNWSESGEGTTFRQVSSANSRCQKQGDFAVMMTGEICRSMLSGIGLLALARWISDGNAQIPNLCSP